MVTKYNLTLLALTLFLLSTNLISAVDVISPYNKENPLKLSPGEKTNIQLTLKNTDRENMTLRATVSGTGASILDGPLYPIASGIDIPVSVEVSAPEEAEIGENYEIEISFKNIKTNDGELLGITSAVTVRIPVQVVDKEENSPDSKNARQNIYVLLGIIAVVGILFTIIKKEHNLK